MHSSAINYNFLFILFGEITGDKKKKYKNYKNLRKDDSIFVTNDI